MAGNFFAKAIGAAAVGLAGYDTLVTTKIQTGRETQLSQIQRLEDTYMRTDSLDTESQVANGLQNWARRWHTRDNWLFRMKDGVCNYVSNFVNNFSANMITLGLGAVALLCGKGKFSPIKIPFVGKIAAAILAFKGASYILRDLFGIGSISDRDRFNSH